MKIKKLLALSLCILILVFSSVACKKENENPEETTADTVTTETTDNTEETTGKATEPASTLPNGEPVDVYGDDLDWGLGE